MKTNGVFLPKKVFIHLLVLLSGLMMIGCSVFGHRTEETPSYQVLEKSQNFEIREYAPYLEATTKVQGSFEGSQKEAFRILADYIFGKNEKSAQISMTAPVVMAEPNAEKISMTAPVIQAPAGDAWVMSFSMPSKYKNLEDLPRPKDPRITLQLAPSKLLAVHTFTGFWSEEKNKKKADELKAWLSKGGQYEILSEPMFAGYDPPWTLPFLRRNEMMILVKKRY